MCRQHLKMPGIPYRVQVRDHPGSSRKDIDNEPSWGEGHQHRVGFKNRFDRLPGLTGQHDEDEEEAIQEFKELQEEQKRGDLINFRDVMTHEKYVDSLLR